MLHFGHPFDVVDEVVVLGEVDEGAVVLILKSSLLCLELVNLVRILLALFLKIFDLLVDGIQAVCALALDRFLGIDFSLQGLHLLKDRRELLLQNLLFALNFIKSGINGLLLSDELL